MAKIKDNLKNMSRKDRNIIVTSCAIWGIVLIGSGSIMTTMITPVEKKPKVQLRVVQKRVEKAKTNEIKLKDMELEVNQPLSVDVGDYLNDIDNVETKIIKQLKLDTSMVNNTQAGTYTYTITYKKKTYNGKFVIKEKPLPTVENMTLRSLSLQVGSSLSTDISTYVVETLTDEVKANTKLNLNNVNTTQAGNYQYTITYNGKLYTGTITIYEPQPILQAPEKKEETKPQEEPKQDPPKTQDTQQPEATPTE